MAYRDGRAILIDFFRVVLSATHEKALDVVDLEDLQAFAVDKPEDQ